MSSHPVFMLIRAKLGELGHAIDHMERVHQQQRRLSQDYPNHYSEPVHVESLATNLQGIYTRAEAILKSVLQEVDNYVPRSDAWHRDLLLQASIATEERPVVISADTRSGMSQLLAFRHAVRNNYAASLRAGDVFRNVDLALAAMPVFKTDLEQFLSDFEGVGKA